MNATANEQGKIAQYSNRPKHGRKRGLTLVATKSGLV